MAHRVIGIEEGDGVVRVAVVETWLRRFELRGVYEHRIGANNDLGDGERLSPLLKEAVVRVIPTPTATDTFVVAFPGDRAFFRTLSFPFRGKSQIEAALPMQMMGMVPVQPDGIHCAFEKVESKLQGATEVLAVAVPVAEFAAFLERFRAEGFDPAHVTLHGVCLFSLVPYLNVEDRVRMILWADGRHADIAVADGLRPLLTRSVLLSEKAIDHGEITPGLMREVMLTAAAVSESGKGIEEVFVSGPEAERMVGPISESLGAPVKVLDPSRLSIPGAENCRGLGPEMTRVVAIALAGASGGGPGTLNLRTQAFALEESHGLFREHARFFVVMFALLAVLGVGRAVTRYIGLNSEREAMLSEVRTFTKNVLGKEKDDPDGVLKTMKATIEEDFRVFPKWTATQTLNTIITAMMEMGAHARPTTDGQLQQTGVPGPNEAYAVELESVRIDVKNASIRGEADSIETLDRLVARLKAEPCFHDVVTESTERIQFERHQGWQRFSLRFAVDCSAKEAPKKQKSSKGGQQ